MDHTAHLCPPSLEILPFFTTPNSAIFRSILVPVELDFDPLEMNLNSGIQVCLIHDVLMVVHLKLAPLVS